MNFFCFHQVVAAATDAQADRFVCEQLPAGYDTMVGGGSSTSSAGLSGGQRQRLVIARALLKNAPILLLDEATSALDAESEFQVQSALQSAMCGELANQFTVPSLSYGRKTGITHYCALHRGVMNVGRPSSEHHKSFASFFNPN